jgi:prolyl-tRNA synthetase
VDYHYTGFNINRDLGPVEYCDIAKAVEGGICPSCGKPGIRVSRGIELGNIFQLGTKYTQTMNMQYTDENSTLHYPIMGCYGIGVGRLAASVCEYSHDEYGPVWPISIAPWQVHLCCMRSDDEQVKAAADDLYEQLQREKIEVIYDDRPVNAGVMFADADLIGAPIRIIMSPRNMKEGCCELATRDKSIKMSVKLADILAETQTLINKLNEQLNA